jgi:hypothetical protein
VGGKSGDQRTSRGVVTNLLVTGFCSRRYLKPARLADRRDSARAEKI